MENIYFSTQCVNIIIKVTFVFIKDYLEILNFDLNHVQLYHLFIFQKRTTLSIRKTISTLVLIFYNHYAGSFLTPIEKNALLNGYTKCAIDRRMPIKFTIKRKHRASKLTFIFF